MNTIPELIEELRQGKPVILVDDEDRENEGDLVLAADFVTPEWINFMVAEARGLVCLALSPAFIERLKLPMMVPEDRNSSPNKTAFTVSIEAARGVTTGISAADRAHTIKVASRPSALPTDIISPGHVFPIRAQRGGVLKRAGHTEASVDLCELCGLNPAAVICEIMNEDGTMARMPQLLNFARKFGLKIGSIVDLIRHRLQNEILVREISRSKQRTFMGEFEVRIFRNLLDGSEHLVLQKGEVAGDTPVLVRVHVENVWCDVFAPKATALERALRLIEAEGRGVLVYLRPQPRAQMPSDPKDYGLGAQILHALGIRSIRLMSGGAAKKAGLKGYGLEIIEQIDVHEDAPLEIQFNESEKLMWEV